MASVVAQTVENVMHNLEVILKEAKDNPAPILRVNADALVVEYNHIEFGCKMFERVADLEKNNS
jgi:hypothetical protein